MMHPPSIVALLLLVWVGTHCTEAFSRDFLFAGRRAPPRRSATTHRSMSSRNDPGMSNPALELTSTLAKLDRQWKMQQSAKPSESRWKQIYLQNPLDVSVEDLVYLLEPPNNSAPSCLIVFWGGAGLGQFPQVAYNELLLELSDRLNAAIVTAPYSVSLNHFALAKQVGELSRRAVMKCQNDPAYSFPSQLPTYCLTHSLGGKLAVIYQVATGQEDDGVGFMSFNNFSFGETMKMAKEFTRQIQGTSNQSTTGFATSGQSSNVWNSIFSVAETIVGSVGIDFSPTSADMDRIIGIKYDKSRQKRTRLFKFDDDTLDNTNEFVQACVDGKDQLQVSALPGNHLTPVNFQVGSGRNAMRGIESDSFGNEDQLHSLVDEVCNWISGKGPSRGPT